MSPYLIAVPIVFVAILVHFLVHVGWNNEKMNRMKDLFPLAEDTNRFDSLMEKENKERELNQINNNNPNKNNNNNFQSTMQGINKYSTNNTISINNNTNNQMSEVFWEEEDEEFNRMMSYNPPSPSNASELKLKEGRKMSQFMFQNLQQDINSRKVREKSEANMAELPNNNESSDSSEASSSLNLQISQDHEVFWEEENEDHLSLNNFNSANPSESWDTDYSQDNQRDRLNSIETSDISFQIPKPDSDDDENEDYDLYSSSDDS